MIKHVIINYGVALILIWINKNQYQYYLYLIRLSHWEGHLSKLGCSRQKATVQMDGKWMTTPQVDAVGPILCYNIPRPFPYWAVSQIIVRLQSLGHGPHRPHLFYTCRCFICCNYSYKGFRNRGWEHQQEANHALPRKVVNYW